MPKQSVLVIRVDDRFSDVLRQSGIGIENLPLIRTEPVPDLSLLIDKLSRLERYHGVIMTSPAAAAVFIEHGEAASLNFQGNFYVLGHRTKAVLEAAGLKVEHFDDANTATELIGQLGTTEFAAKRLLFVRGNRSMRTVPALLGTVAEIDEVIVYNTVEEVPADRVLFEVRGNLNRGRYGWVCFFSPSGIENFVRYFGNDLPEKTMVATIGSTTAEAARSAGLNVQLVSPKSDAEVFARELAGRIRQNEQ